MPEVTLVVLLLVTFVADFATSQKIRTLAPTDKRRSWFNPMICLLMFAHILINLFPIETHTVFGGMYPFNSTGSPIRSCCWDSA